VVGSFMVATVARAESGHAIGSFGSATGDTMVN
jgi:hypothetical protein